MKPLISSKVRQQLDVLRDELPHAILLTGQMGVGLYTIASWLAKYHGFVRTVKPQLLTKTSTVPQISIDHIRELYEITRTKQPKGLVIIIDDADSMTLAAQHSFLKLLEEPNDNIHFILTAHTPEVLLPTVRSRTQATAIPLLNTQETTKYIKSLGDFSAQKMAQLQFIAQGSPAELYRLVHDEAYFAQATARMQIIKILLAKDIYQRLVVVLAHKFTRQEALEYLALLIAVLQRRPQDNPARYIEQCLLAYEAIKKGGAPKLHFAKAVV